MPAVQASVVLTTARTLLNDDAASLWTDAALMPKLAQAHRELQTKLRFAAAPVMKAISADIAVGALGTTIQMPADGVEPIRLWERGPAQFIHEQTLMTEVDVIPTEVQTAVLNYWQWSVSVTGALEPEQVNLLGCVAAKLVKMLYWRRLTVPVINTDSIHFINGELYLAPRTAAIAAGSVGSKDVYDAATIMARESLEEVILSNRGNLRPQSGTRIRP